MKTNLDQKQLQGRFGSVSLLSTSLSIRRVDACANTHTHIYLFTHRDICSDILMLSFITIIDQYLCAILPYQCIIYKYLCIFYLPTQSSQKKDNIFSIYVQTYLTKPYSACLLSFPVIPRIVKLNRSAITTSYNNICNIIAQNL